MSTTQNISDFDWQAQQYLLDELAADDRTAFEAALAEEPPARDALAAATELLLSVKQAEAGAKPVGVASSAVGRPVSWIAAMAAGIVCAFLVGQQVGTNSDDSGDTASPTLANFDAERVINLYSESGPLVTTTTASTEVEPIPEVNPPSEPNGSAESHHDVPAWMLAAVGADEAACNDGEEEWE